MKYVWVALGGGLGAALRFSLSRWIGAFWQGSFPAGTFAVNLIGCLAIGALTAFFERYVLPPDVRLFLVVGVLGGFTTFSSFSLETFQLFRDREVPAALANLILSNAAGILCTVIGYLAVRALADVLSAPGTTGK